MCKGLGREEMGGGALLREPVWGVGSVDKALIHRTAHYSAGRGCTQRVAGYQSSVQDEIPAEQNNVKLLLCRLTSRALSVKVLH